MFIIQCPILWYAKVCALPSARSSLFPDFFLWRNQRGLFGYYLFHKVLFISWLYFLWRSRKGLLMLGYVWKTINLYIKAPLRSSDFFCCKLTPALHQRREKLCGPHRKKFGDPCSWPTSLGGNGLQQRGITSLLVVALFRVFDHRISGREPAQGTSDSDRGADYAIRLRPLTAESQ